MTQRERRPLGGAEGRRGAPVSPSSFQTALSATVTTAYNAEQSRNRVGHPARHTQVREQAETEVCVLAGGAQGTRQFLVSRTRVFLGPEKEFWVAVR